MERHVPKRRVERHAPVTLSSRCKNKKTFLDESLKRSLLFMVGLERTVGKYRRYRSVSTSDFTKTAKNRPISLTVDFIPFAYLS